jgi:damage-control phosphatase, subfamily I
MKIPDECKACMIAQVKNVSAMLNLSKEQQETAHRLTLDYIGAAGEISCTPESMGEMWDMLQKYIGVCDPYEKIRSLCNQEAMKLIPAIREKIARSQDPLKTALKYAVAGNLIDYGLQKPLSLEEQNEQIDSFAGSHLATDDCAQMREALFHAKTLLVLGDNAGEIVFDKLLIECIRADYPHLSVTYAVKGLPILNDVLYADALEVGMDAVARIIDNGDSSPGTVLSRASETFQREFAKADVILSKGQGNYESLWDAQKENLFFLFTVKCDIISAMAEVPKHSIVCLKKR